MNLTPFGRLVQNSIAVQGGTRKGARHEMSPTSSDFDSTRSDTYVYTNATLIFDGTHVRIEYDDGAVVPSIRSFSLKFEQDGAQQSVEYDDDERHIFDHVKKVSTARFLSPLRVRVRIPQELLTKGASEEPSRS